ncbi:MAG: NAD-dependent succinate-semialdehyde dehydrogenase [Ilumatobacteraceae bacterium]
MSTPGRASLLINGNWVNATTGATYAVTNPATGVVLQTVSDGGAADVLLAIDAAAAAFPGWRRTVARERGRLLHRTAGLLRDRADSIGRLMTEEQGKPLAEATGEVEYAASFFEWFAGEAERIEGMIVPSQQPDQRVLVTREPIGITAAITPWNFPAAMLARKIAPALAAGCPMIIKPAESTPLTALAVAEALIDAGLPPGVLGVITSDDAATVSGALFGDGRVRKVSFTGSTEVGRLLIEASAEQIVKLSLELGGHAPYLIFDDADLDRAVDQVIACKFRNAGQTCVCTNRVYVQRSIVDDFTARVAAKVAELQVGNGLRTGVTVGPLIDGDGLAKVERHVRDAIAKGAECIVGGTTLTGGEYDSGSFFAPTVLLGIDADMDIAREETFGPVLGITPFDTEIDALAMANSTLFGLAAYAHTRDHARLFRCRGGPRARNRGDEHRADLGGQRPLRWREAFRLRS